MAVVHKFLRFGVSIFIHHEAGPSPPVILDILLSPLTSVYSFNIFSFNGWKWSFSTSNSGFWDVLKMFSSKSRKILIVDWPELREGNVQVEKTQTTYYRLAGSVMEQTAYLWVVLQCRRLPRLMSGLVIDDRWVRTLGSWEIDVAALCVQWWYFPSTSLQVSSCFICTPDGSCMRNYSTL